MNRGRLMSAHIDELRHGWQGEIAKLDGMIAHLESGNLMHTGRRDAAAATAQWLIELRRRHAELENLLTEFPGA
jgi:soluble cytochrome b562